MTENLTNIVPSTNATMPSTTGAIPSLTGVGIFTTQPISLGMAYVPLQQWREIYELPVAFERGTIFRELDKPFLGEEAVPHDR